ncbi:MAG TPA: UPF0175 family protein [Acidobacteriaceae bacterium]|nr:UPF0175 family protein [Acidobacteriaceae bacterium]
MQLTLTIPDHLAAQIAPPGEDPSRAALEAVAIDGYRAGRLSENEVSILLGYETRMQVQTLLTEHGVDLQYTSKHLQQDIEASEKLYSQRTNR